MFSVADLGKGPPSLWAKILKVQMAEKKFGPHLINRSRSATGKTQCRVQSRGHEWSLKIFKRSQNQAFAQIARKILVGARLLELAYFYNLLTYSVFNRKVFFCKVLVACKANFYQCSCSQRKLICSHARKDHSIPLNLYINYNFFFNFFFVQIISKAQNSGCGFTSDLNHIDLNT